jgi:hypothetical protein
VKHYTEEDLILYYYNESGRRRDIEVHLDQCESCGAAFRALAGTLKLIETPETPERGDQYGLEVWQRIRHGLPEQEVAWWSMWLRADRLAVAGAFVTGRWWSSPDTAPTPVAVNRLAAAPAASDDSRQRILLSSVAEHFDRSERVLTDIMNAPAGEDISAEQRWAEDLVVTSRLYRQDAVDAGEHSVALVLDELERNLLEVVHSPSKVTTAHLDDVRKRIDAASLLFKVRVLGDELRQRELTAPSDAPHARAISSQIS